VRCGVEGDVKIRLRWEEVVDWRKERDGSDGRFRLDLETCQRKTASRPWLFKNKDELSARLQKRERLRCNVKDDWLNLGASPIRGSLNPTVSFGCVF
jgi:hypothetical protein